MGTSQSPRPWRSWFWPTVIEQQYSQINGQIQVLRFWNEYRLVVSGITQTGGLVTNLWSQALTRINRSHFYTKPPRSILILGLGGGSCLRTIDRLWPTAVIIGIELDQIMVQLGRHYFHLEQFPRLTVVIADATSWLKKNSPVFDLILVDLYQGGSFPIDTFSSSFITLIHHHLTSQGVVIFNLLGPTVTRSIKKLLDQEFAQVYLLKTSINQVYAAA